MSGSNLCNVPLVTDTRVALLPKGLARHQTVKRPVLVDKEEKAQDTKGEGSRAVKRRRRKEASPINVESYEGI